MQLFWFSSGLGFEQIPAPKTLKTFQKIKFSSIFNWHFFAQLTKKCLLQTLLNAFTQILLKSYHFLL